MVSDEWAEHRERLADCAQAIEDAKDGLEAAYDARWEAVADAADDDMPYREIGAELGVSHTMVGKLIRQWVQVQQIREMLFDQGQTH